MRTVVGASCAARAGTVGWSGMKTWGFVILCWRWKHASGIAWTAEVLIPRFLRALHQLRNAGLAQLVQLGQTLTSWSQEIVAMWRFTRNNGITEGFHNKMELINRQAYGFRNFENYRLRVKVLCGRSAWELDCSPVVGVEPELCGTPERIRTSDLLLRRQAVTYYQQLSRARKNSSPLLNVASYQRLR